MTQTNRNRVGSALEILSRGLKPFIEREMQAFYKERWFQEATHTLSVYNLARTHEGELPGDLQVLLQVLEKQWYNVFRTVLEDAKRSLVGEIRETRNNWAHQVEFRTDDAYRAIDSVQRLLIAVSASSLVGELERQKDELLRILFEEQSYLETRDREAEIRLSTEVLWQSKQMELSEQLTTFTDRREAIALFDLITTHDSVQLSPYFPILAFVAYGGRGKSTLINYLRAKRCYSTNGKVLLPYAHLNFTEDNAPQDLLSILVALRDQLQLHRDERGKPLAFPRFDLAASIALAVQGDKDLSFMSRDQIVHYLSGGLPYIDIYGNMNKFLREYCYLFQAILSGILQNAQIPELQLLLQRLEMSPGWRWYLQQNSDLGADADIGRILLYLYTSSLPPQHGSSGLDDLIKEQLPKALLADLKEAIEVFVPSQNENKKISAVIFLDGFEALINILGRTNARHLLEMLSINQFEGGEIAPLLLVIGSRHELLEMTETEHSFFRMKRTYKMTHL